MDARADEEFTRFVAGRTAALLRWRHIEEHPEAYVRRVLYHESRAGWTTGTCWRPGVPARARCSDPVDRPGPRYVHGSPTLIEGR